MSAASSKLNFKHRARVQKYPSGNLGDALLSSATDLIYNNPCSRNETKYEKILDAADFASREYCSFITFNDAFRKTLLKAVKNTLRQPTTRAEFTLIRALISN